MEKPPLTVTGYANGVSVAPEVIRALWPSRPAGGTTAAEANAAIDAAYVHHVRELERQMHEARYRLDAATRDYANACDRYRAAAAPSSFQPATKI